MKENPFYKNTHQQRGAFPFHELSLEDYFPAFERAIELAKKRVQDIAERSEEVTFKNTLEALIFSDEELERVSTIFYNLLSAEATDGMHELAQKIGPMLASHSNDVALNSKLFKKIKNLYDQKSTLNLNVEEAKILDKNYKSFIRNGALLGDEKKELLREIDGKLSKLGPSFSENVLKDETTVELHIENKSELDGLPERSLAQAQEYAQKKDKEGYLFPLQYPFYIPFMTFVKSAELRQKYFLAFASRAHESNQSVVLDIVELREQRAQLLGFENHADFILQERMAKSPAKVEEFIKKIVHYAQPAAQKDLDSLKSLKKEMGSADEFQAWDLMYYKEILKNKTLNLDEEELRQYFPLSQVRKGLFQHIQKLFGLSFKLNQEIQYYHSDVEVYEVFDEQNKFVSLLSVDLFPRATKKSGAWMCSYREQGNSSVEENERPIIGVVCNFTPPTANQESCLSFNEVLTYFHEFGHALHGMLSQCQYKTLSGTNTLWDFVELPSQIMENWVYEKETLQLISKHVETGEVLSDEMVEKILASKVFFAGYNSMRQATFAWLDYSWHTTPRSEIKDVASFEDQVLDWLRVFPKVPGSLASTAFQHIFYGGYSSGYYSYKWAEVLDADAFEYFKEKGVYSKETADSFKKNILEKGGTEDPEKLYQQFRGRDADPLALFRRDSLLNA